MKLNEFKAGDKIRRTPWSEKDNPNAYYEILFMGERAVFGRYTSGAETPLYFGMEDDWVLYKEPNKKVTRWLWVSIHGELNGVMSEEPPHDHPIKLEWSAQEF